NVKNLDTDDKISLLSHSISLIFLAISIPRSLPLGISIHHPNKIYFKSILYSHRNFVNANQDFSYICLLSDIKLKTHHILLNGVLLILLCCIWQQGNIPCTLNCDSQLSLMFCTIA